MTDPAGTITILLDGHQRVYQPAEMLSGEYSWSVAPSVEVKAVEMSVLWRTEGKGDEDFGVHFFDRFSLEDGDEMSSQQSARFSVQLPNSPLSYDGAIVKILWLVRVRLFLRHDKEKEVVGEKGFQLGTAPSVRAIVS